MRKCHSLSWISFSEPNMLITSHPSSISLSNLSSRWPITVTVTVQPMEEGSGSSGVSECRGSSGGVDELRLIPFPWNGIVRKPA